jgi:acyl-homoserine lactone acylase PvdQ
VSRAVVLVAVLALVVCAPASAQIPELPGLPGGGSGAPVEPYGANDAGGFRDILPPGTRGHYNAVELAAFLATGQTVPHCCDQLPMYRDLVYATPGLKAADIPKFFKDSTFGVRPEDVERTYSPRADVTIVRDRPFGVPHVYGRTRDGAMFGLGYVAAEDRVFFMDALRHAGRGELSSFAGGANQAQDAEQWEVAPYTEADLQRQADQAPEAFGPQGVLLRRDADNYIAGVNRYISEAKLDVRKLPGEYVAIGRPQGPDPWTRADLIATASLVGGIFGKGGGHELEWSEIADALEQRFGQRRGAAAFRDFRAAEDPEAPVEVLRGRFPYQAPSRNVRRASVARPDPGSLRKHEVVQSGEAAPPGGLAGLLKLPSSASNALLVSGRHSASGRPLFVAGPQVAYFNPQILLEQDVHAPAAPGLPGIDARGASFIGVNLYVQLGRGRDYAWSATSAGQDNIDTFAVDLCEPDGSQPTVDSMHYRFRGRCLAIEVLEKTNRWMPTPADQTPPGTQTLRAERTKLGLVAGRGTVRGRPVAFTKLRSTYFHEIDSAAGFMDFNDPAAVRDAESFQRAASKIGYTFNWHYADAEQIAYFNSGANPVRAPRIDHNFPVRGTRANEWRGWNPDAWTARFTPFEQHPRVIDQEYIISWNNKQARGFRSSDETVYTSTYRSVLLEDRLKAALAGGRKLDLAGAIDIMEQAGTADLRAHAVLPVALEILGTPRDPELAAAVSTLREWLAAGGQRRDKNADGVYDHSEAVRILDAWWPRWVEGQFKPVIGPVAWKRLTSTIAVDNDPNLGGSHLGSAYQGSWYGHVSKDLRGVLGKRVRGAYSREYCGRGSLARCRRMLASTLRAAARVPASEVYKGDPECSAGDQWCWDAVRFRPVGGATQPLIHWINRPTYQQANEVQRRLPR